MKKLILISILAILSLKIMAQEVNTDEYKNYKPYTEHSVDQWQNSRSGVSSNRNTSGSNQTGFFHTLGAEIKNASKTVVFGCITVITALTGVIIYQKLNNEISTIH